MINGHAIIICYMKRVVDWLAENFKRDEGVVLLNDKQALQRLTEAAEKAKMELSSLTQANIRYVICIYLTLFFIQVHIILLAVCCTNNFLFFQLAFHYCYCRWA